jgi:hypothetical protein
MGKFFIYNSRSDKEWPPSEAILVSDILLSEKYTDHAKEKYYPIPERNTPDDIRRRINRIKERPKAKQKERKKKVEN